MPLFKRRATDPWDGSSGTYFVPFRNQLVSIAEKLSRNARFLVSTRYNGIRKQVEFYNEKDEVVVIIHIRAEAGVVDKIIVVSNLPRNSKELFKNLPVPCVEFSPFSC